MSTARTNRFPLPWYVEEQVGCFVVRASNGQALSKVYFGDASKSHLFTRDEARHLAGNMAKLPELLSQAA
jgi:hypothetical protein